MIRWLAILCVLACWPASAHAEAALADIFFMLPKMLFFGGYLFIRKYLWVLLILAALGWAAHLAGNAYRDKTGCDEDDPVLRRFRRMPSHRVTSWLLGIALLWMAVIHVGYSKQLDSLLEEIRLAEMPPPETPLPPPDPMRLINPYGGNWPDRMGYLPGAPMGALNGSTDILISNSLTGVGVYVKLCRYGEQPCKGLRHAYIGAGWYFRMERVHPGEYELRYRQVMSPGIADRSRKVVMTGDAIADDVKWQIIAAPGREGPPNAQFFAIDPADF